MKKQDKTPVLINLVSTIRDEEGEQEAPMQLFCRGELKKTASGYLIRYQESMPTEDDSEMVTSDVILSLSEHRVTMSRPGEYGTTMVFVKDQRFEGAYHTPFGDMAMAVFPTQVVRKMHVVERFFKTKAQVRALVVDREVTNVAKKAADAESAVINSKF